jgi:flagellar M-ring protein FliF|tara:strand:- start:21077 stop:22807 length:1731 start_codon:yes stop_codon:yes gene_type:complete
MAETGVKQQPMQSQNNGGVSTGSSMNPIDAFAQSRAVRHFGRLIGLAAAVAIGTVVALWTSEPNYAPLYSNMSGQDTAQIVDLLRSNDIDFKLDASSGSIMVDQAKLPEARLKVSAQGLPSATTLGMEMLQGDQGLGTSQFIETARYNHALEAELVRSVESIRSVEKARIHLAIPKQSIFIRNRIKPSASVVIKLYPGRVLSPGQVDAIVQMVAASIPMLEGGEVAVVDQFGRLLTQDDDAGMAQTNKQYDYSRLLEDNMADRIIKLLQPIVGNGKVNAQVAAQLDFAVIESTREAFDPERSVIRSEQISEEKNTSLSNVLGIPGALSNKPPVEATTEAKTDQDTVEVKETTPTSQNSSSTRNFEVDRVISHTNSQVGSIQRLSVAVVIDDKSTIMADGSTEKTAYSDEDIARFVTLVKETIGFDVNRGDSVSVINTSFLQIEQEVIAEMPWWKSILHEVWILNLAKQVFGAIGLLIIYLIFGRPFLRTLLPNRIEVDAQSQALATNNNTGNASSISQGGEGNPMALSHLSEDPNNQAANMRRKDATYDQKVDMARSLVLEDPARVANVMKNWVSE